jgi:serine-type D-Ala-D-Ala carboxypeptidase/endopeptidase
VCLHGDDSSSPLAAAARETRRRRADLDAIGVGLGWLILPPGTDSRSRRLSSEALMHEGGTGGVRSFAAVVPETGTAIVVLANQARSVGRLGMQLLQVVTR